MARLSARVEAHLARAAKYRRRQLEARLESRRKNFKVFLAPDHLLDIVSEDNPYARDFEERDELEQKAKWAKDPKLDAVSARFAHLATEIKEAEGRLASNVEKGSSPWHITQYDVLASALIRLPLPGNPSASGPGLFGGSAVSAGRQAELSQVVYQNALPKQSRQDRGMLTHFMLRGLGRRPKSPLLVEPGVLSKALRGELHGPTPAEGRRLLFQSLWRLGVYDQRDAMNNYAPGIASALRGGDELPAERASGTLEIINNLAARLAAKEIELPSSLCFLGIEAAVLCCQFWTAQRFLELGVRLGHFKSTIGNTEADEGHVSMEEKDVARVILRVPDAVFSSNHEQLRERRRYLSNSNLMSELFTFLTGYSLVRSDRQLSMRDFLTTDKASPTWRAYLRILTRLGAARVLWHEAQREINGQVGNGVKNSGVFSAPPPAPPSLTGNFVDDVALDLEFIAT